MGEAETHNETTKTAKSNKDNPGTMSERKEEQLDWEELRKIVRQLETEIYQRLADYGQLQSDLKSIDDNDVSQLSKRNDLLEKELSSKLDRLETIIDQMGDCVAKEEELFGESDLSSSSTVR